MAANRLNVLHWHMFGSYSFAYNASSFPTLAEKGAWSSRAVYSPDEVRALVYYAQERGIRVVPELDVPGHAYSWGLAYPGSVSKCPPDIASSDIGAINDVPLNPISDEALALLHGLLTEFRTLFPDKYLHLGGDEVQLECWKFDKVG